MQLKRQLGNARTAESDATCCTAYHSATDGGEWTAEMEPQLHLQLNTFGPILAGHKGELLLVTAR